MFLELVGVTVYSISACKAAKVPRTSQEPAQAGTQMTASSQPVAHATAVAQPAFSSQTGMPMAVAQCGHSPGAAMAVAQAIPIHTIRRIVS